MFTYACGTKEDMTVMTQMTWRHLSYPSQIYICGESVLDNLIFHPVLENYHYT